MHDFSPDQAIAQLASRLQPIECEAAPLSEACGRVLREAILADRDSPAADVSAMDGYAVRMTDLSASEALPVIGESRPGHAPPPADARAVMRIFTGGIVPAEFDAVIRREDTEETETHVRLLPAAQRASAGQNIRRRGENIRESQQVVAAGTLLNIGSIAAAANFGVPHPRLAKPVRVSIIVTGDELRGADHRVEPWQVRDSNGHAIAALLNNRPWIRVTEMHSTPDSLDAISDQLRHCLASSDAVVLTGGVSMGDYDHVPAAVAACGGEVVFHRLPLRPGKPILGAATEAGKLILGLPGNPVSAGVCARRFLIPLLSSMAQRHLPPRPRLALQSPSEQTLPLWWMRLAQLTPEGQLRLIAGKGSGDLVALAHSDGFVEQPPESSGSGPWPFWSWSDL